MELRPITSITMDEFAQLGHFGYVSTRKLECSREETEIPYSYSVRFNLIDVDPPYVKEEMNDEEDLKRYNQLVKLGYSYGVYVDQQFVALAIAEPQYWNNTLLIWHLQVHERHQRKGYGKILIDKMADMARDKGLRAVTVETQNTNVAAVQFYMQCGFQIEGIDLSLYSNNDTGNEEIALYMRMKIPQHE